MRQILLPNLQIRQLAVLLLLLFVGIVRRTEFYIILRANAGDLALNSAYAQPNLATNQLQLAQITLVAKANQNAGQVSAWAQAGLAYILQNKNIEAKNAWQHSTLPAETLLQYAAHARQFGYTQTALEICDLVIAIAPTLRDPWYYKGDIWASQKKYEAALAAFQYGLESTDHGSFGQSDIYLRIGEIYALFLPVSDLETAQLMYEQAIERNDFMGETDLIRTHFLYGEAFRISGKLTEAMAEYEQVLSLNQNHYWANIRLGQLLSSENQDFPAAEALLLQAVVSNEDEKGAYKALGTLYLENDRFPEAQMMYEEVLRLDSTDAQAIQALELLLDKVP